MGQPAAKQGDKIIGTDTHLVMVPAPTPTPTPVMFPFTGTITGGLSADVSIMGKPAAVVGSTADNTPAHLPPPGAPFQRPPSNQAIIDRGSATVNINGKPAARSGDPASTCNDVPTPRSGTVVATGTVVIG